MLPGKEASRLMVLYGIISFTVFISGILLFSSGIAALLTAVVLTAFLAIRFDLTGLHKNEVLIAVSAFFLHWFLAVIGGFRLLQFRLGIASE